MAPRSLTNPAPKTESAREARKSFFCELCQKGYSRMNEFEAHEASYDHQHKKRLKEMKKQIHRNPNAIDKARRAERKAEEKSGLISIKPLNPGSLAAGSSGGGFKKGGFKSAFAPADDGPAEIAKPTTGFKKALDSETDETLGKCGDEESDTDECGYEYYDPRRPTGCGDDCQAP